MILDEYAIAEEIIKKKHITKSEDLFIAAKYLRREMKCDTLETYAILNSIMVNSFSNFKPLNSATYLENMALKAIEYDLKRIEEIKITTKELNKILEVESSKQKRLLFTLLVYSKYYNELSSSNNNWCNISISELFRVSRVSTRNNKEKALMLCKLNNQGMIDFSRKNVNHNIKCLIVDESNKKIALGITDLRELGYQYINIYDKTQFTYCAECGRIIKKDKKNDYSKKYCNECKQTMKNEQNLNRFQKLGKAYPLSDQ